MAKMYEDVNQVEKLRDSSTFALWKFQVNIIFKSNSLIGVVNGNEKKEGLTADALLLWERIDAKAQQVIVTTIDKKVMMHIINCESSHDMYKKLCAIYERDTEQQKCNLLQDFFNYTFSAEADIATNISRLENIAFKLKTLNKQIDDEMVISKILCTLPEQYKHFRSAWDSTNTEEKNLENLTARLLNEESCIRSENKNGEPVAFKVLERRCWKCNSGDHLARSCDKSKIQVRNVREQRCFKCDSRFHLAKDCGKNKTNRRRCSICKKDNHCEKDCYFRKNGKQAVSFFAQESRRKDLVDKWVVDSGSSSHMVNNNVMLKNPVKISTEIGLAKKSEVMKAECFGSIEADNCVLKNVLYVPQLSKNLLSVNAITQNDGEVKFIKNRVEISKHGNIVLEGYKNEKGLYEIDLNQQGEALICEQKNPVSWHRKLGHLSGKNMKILLKNSIGMELTDDDIKLIDDPCDICLRAKQTRFPFKSQRTRATRPLELIHSDVCGPIEVSTWDRKKYFLTCLDDYTHFVMVFLIENKFEVGDALKQYIEEVEAKWSLRVSKLRCDNGGEYVSHKLVNWCKSRGIVLDYSIPHTPQLNGKAERMNRTLFEKVRALVFDSGVEKEMWGEALRTAAYLLNRSPTEATTATPAEMWYQKKPDLSRLQIFGSIAYAKVLGRLKKLDSRSNRLTFVGYTENGYRLWNQKTEKIQISRDVVFLEPKFDRQNDLISPFKSFNFQDDTTEDEEDSNNIDQIASEQNIEELGRGKRTKKPPVYLGDYALLTFEEAISGADKELWKEAIEEEKKSLERNETWQVVDKNVAGNKKILSNKWIFKIKDNGKYKARLVVRGCEQKYGIDYEETYSPVVSIIPLRIIFGLAIKKQYKMMKFDIKTAFLYGHLDEEIYMSMPEGYDDRSKICKLRKALYGLKQAPIKWNKRLTDFLRENGFVQIKSEQCIFITEDKEIILAIYVDDGILIGSDHSRLIDFLDKLRGEFDITYEEPHSFLGMNLKLNDDTLKIHQELYSNHVLEKFRMSDANATSTPLIQNGTVNSVNEKESAFPYREAIGSLLYLSCRTRPDLSFAVAYGSRHVENPSDCDISNLKRTLRYLKGSKDLGIVYTTSGSDTELNAYCDADYAGDPDTRRSTTGYVIYFCGGPVSWCSRKQPIVATSSTEAEYIAAAECCKGIFPHQFQLCAD